MRPLTLEFEGHLGPDAPGDGEPATQPCWSERSRVAWG